MMNEHNDNYGVFPDLPDTGNEEMDAAVFAFLVLTWAFAIAGFLYGVAWIIAQALNFLGL